MTTQALQEVPLQAAIAWRWQEDDIEYEICWPIGALRMLFAYRHVPSHYWENAFTLLGPQWANQSRTKEEAHQKAMNFLATQHELG